MITIEDMKEILKAERMSKVELILGTDEEYPAEASFWCNLKKIGSQHRITFKRHTLEMYPDALPHFLMHEIAHARRCNHTMQRLTHDEAWRAETWRLLKKYNIDPYQTVYKYAYSDHYLLNVTP